MNLTLVRSNAAVSTVIAAMLILAVLITFISAINAYYIPSISSENEIRHMQEVRDSFIELSSKIASGNSISKVHIPLGSEKMVFGPSVSSSGTLTVEPNSSWINISMKDVAEPAKIFGPTHIITNVTYMSSLFILKEGGLPASYDVIIDQDNMLHAEWVGDSTLLIETDKNGSQVYYKKVATPLIASDEYFSLDVLNPAYGFADVVEDIEKPYSLLLDGSFYVEYEKIPPYDNDEVFYTYDKVVNVSTGCFRYVSANKFWIDQNFIFENGAVIMQQSTSKESLIRSEPFISVDDDGKTLYLKIFNIRGVTDSVSGNGVSTVNVKVETKEERTYPFVGKTTLIISSDHPDAWFRYLSTIGEAKMLGDGTVEASFSDMSVKLSCSDVTIMVP